MKIFALALLLPSLAFADAINVTITTQVTKNKGAVTVHIEIIEPIAGFRLVLTRDGGKPQEWKGGGKPGVTRHIELTQPDGISNWAGELTINYPNGQTGSMPLEFQGDVVVPMDIKVDKQKDVDLEGRKLRFTANQQVSKVHLKVLMDTGAAVIDDDIAFKGEPAGTKLEVTWPAGSGTIFRVELRVFGLSGVYNGVELTPWRIDIPHEEVNFASGKWDIPDDEAKKLEASLKLVQDAIEKFSSMAEIKLYVLGHTDTVGSTAS
ncbi:MAG: OmpA family protein, partial [Archangium sp.]|nr:OmpA family protein [Archangium sp.]